MGAWTDCSRASANSTKMPAATTHIACMKSCESSSSCASWQFTASTSSCVLNKDVPLTSHLVGSWCGIKSKDGWQLKNGGLTRSTRPLTTGPSMGDMTLRPVLGSPGTVTASFASANDPSMLYKTFAEHGSFPTGSLVQNGDAAHGAVSVSTELEAGAKTTLSLVFSWHFPDRDFSHIILGNMCALSLHYSHLSFSYATSVACLSHCCSLPSCQPLLSAMSHHHRACLCGCGVHTGTPSCGRTALQ
jgi:hypothetical protein